MRGDQSQGFDFSAWVTRARGGMKLVAHRIVPNDAVSTAESMSGGGVKQSATATPANSRLIGSSGA